MSRAAELLDRLGRPGDVRLGTARPVAIARFPTGLSALDDALGGGLPRGRIVELAPETAAATGVTLARTLWVRPRDVDAAFRAAEIVLGAGGFGLVVLDVDARDGAPWPRLARAAERGRSTLLVVASRRGAGTFAAVGLELTGRRVRWDRGPGQLVMLGGMDSRLSIARSRVGRPGQALVVRQ